MFCFKKVGRAVKWRFRSEWGMRVGRPGRVRGVRALSALGGDGVSKDG